MPDDVMGAVFRGMELQASIDAITGTRAGFDARGLVVALSWL